MIGIVDYGVGNLFSLKSSLKFLGVEHTVSADKEELARCDRLILPGVGAFGDARAIHDFSLLPLAPHVHTVRAAQSGIVDVSALALGKACCALGGGRTKANDAVDHTVAILLKKRAGERAEKGEPLAEIYYQKQDRDAFALAEGAFSLREDHLARPLVYAFIGEE